MNTLTAADALDWAERFAETVERRSAELTELDRRAGDGDFGTNLRSALRRASGAFATRTAGTVEGVFSLLSDAFLNTGGTSGPLFGMWFRELAKASNVDVGVPVLADAVDAGVAAVRRLGGADVGDKTMVDAMVPAAQALRAAAARDAGLPEAVRDAARAARSGAEGTGRLLARRGRASYVGEHARGVIDPGALTVAYFFESFPPAKPPAAGKVIVTIAPTGGFLTRADNPYVPVQPEEIAEDVRRCHDAGASMAALHARRPDGLATCDPQIYRNINELVRASCEVVINNSTGGGVSGDMTVRTDGGRLEVDWQERLKGLDGGAETCTLDAITAYAFATGTEVLMDTPPSRGRELAGLMRDKGIKPEWEAFGPAHIAQDITTLIHEGFDSAPHLVNIVLGLHTVFQNAMPYSPRTLQYLVDLLPEGSVFTVSVSGAEQTRGLTHALLLGGHVRVGIEDNPFYEPGRTAENVRFVERIVRIIHELGLEPATPAEARTILGLPQLRRAAA